MVWYGCGTDFCPPALTGYVLQTCMETGVMDFGLLAVALNAVQVNDGYEPE